MEYRSLDITLFSADNIKDVNVFGKMDVYAVVSILGYPRTKKKTEKKSKVDMNCGTSPRWNHKMQFIIDEQSLSNPNFYLLIKLKADKPVGDKHIGEVSIPIQELFEDNTNTVIKKNDAGERVVEYQVKTSSGKSKGTLKFFYKFGEKFSSDDNIETKKDGKGHGQLAGPSMSATGNPSHPAQGMGYPGMQSPRCQQLHLGTGVPGYQRSPPPVMLSPRYQQMPPGMLSPRYQQMPPGTYPMYPHPQGYGGYPQQGGHAPPGCRHCTGYGYQQPV